MQNGSPEQKNGVSFRFPGVFCVYYSLRNIKSSSPLCLLQSKGAKFFDLSAARFFCVKASAEEKTQFVFFPSASVRAAEESPFHRHLGRGNLSACVKNHVEITVKFLHCLRITVKFNTRRICKGFHLYFV